MMLSTSNTDPTLYRLAVMTPADDRDAALTVLQETLGMNAIDARTRLAHLPAVWRKEFTEGAAREAAQRLQALGAVAAAVRSTDVPDLHPGCTLHHVQCGDDGLVIMSNSGQPERTIAWENVALLSVADVAGLRQETIGGVPGGVFWHAPGIVETHLEEHGLEMWLVCDSPVTAYRVDAELMNYEYLQDRRSLQGAANFAQLVADIRRYAPNIMLTASAQAFVKGSLGARTIPDAQSIRDGVQMPSPAAHRDAVAAYWALKQGARTSTQSSPAVSSRPAGDVPESLGEDRLIQAQQTLQKTQ